MKFSVYLHCNVNLSKLSHVMHQINRFLAPTILSDKRNDDNMLDLNIVFYIVVVNTDLILSRFAVNKLCALLCSVFFFETYIITQRLRLASALQNALARQDSRSCEKPWFYSRSDHDSPRRQLTYYRKSARQHGHPTDQPRVSCKSR